MEGARAAGPDDLPTCRALLDTALGDAASMRGGPALLGAWTPDELLGRWSADPTRTALFVGEYEHVVVGLGAVTVLEAAPATPTPPTGRTGRIECCYVEAGARGVGVGSELMATLVRWCAAQGCGNIDALALPGDRATKQRLETAGFTARLLVLNRSLG